jgi:hypothetical protein
LSSKGKKLTPEGKENPGLFFSKGNGNNQYCPAGSAENAKVKMPLRPKLKKGSACGCAEVQQLNIIVEVLPFEIERFCSPMKICPLQFSF